MQRTLEPELLDSLPPSHPDALHNRRDLRITNAILGNHRWLRRILPGLMRPDERLVEIGAGTGELSQSLHGAGLRVDGLDLWPKPDGWRETAVWHVGDLRSFDGYPAYAGIVGNLIFHQFADEDLRGLGEKLQRHARVIVACEPHRRRISQVLYRTLGPLFGANHVSLHDAHVSIAAGFRDDELPVALGLAAKFWAVRISYSTLGLYRMIAVRH